MINDLNLSDLIVVLAVDTQAVTFIAGIQGEWTTLFSPIVDLPNRTFCLDFRYMTSRASLAVHTYNENGASQIMNITSNGAYPVWNPAQAEVKGGRYGLQFLIIYMSTVSEDRLNGIDKVRLLEGNCMDQPYEGRFPMLH